MGNNRKAVFKLPINSDVIYDIDTSGLTHNYECFPPEVPEDQDRTKLRVRTWTKNRTLWVKCKKTIKEGDLKIKREGNFGGKLALVNRKTDEKIYIRKDQKSTKITGLPLKETFAFVLDRSELSEHSTCVLKAEPSENVIRGRMWQAEQVKWIKCKHDPPLKVTVKVKGKFDGTLKLINRKNKNVDGKEQTEEEKEIGKDDAPKLVFDNMKERDTYDLKIVGEGLEDNSSCDWTGNGNQKRQKMWSDRVIWIKCLKRKNTNSNNNNNNNENSGNQRRRRLFMKLG